MTTLKQPVRARLTMAQLRQPLAIAGALVLAIAVIALAAGLQPSGRNGRIDILNEAQVVARLQGQDKAYPDHLRALMQAARDQPKDLAAGLAAANGLIAEGRARGESRLVGAALGLLRPFMTNASSQTLTTAANAKQYQHDFPGALALLDQAIALDPRDANSYLARATIQIVTGHLDLAAADCQAIFALARPDVGFLCQATSLTMTAEAPKVYDRLKAIEAAPGVLDPSLRIWAISLMGEIAWLQGDAQLARRHFSAVVAADPLALRERLLLVDLLLGAGEAQAALDLLKVAPQVDGVLIRRIKAVAMLAEAPSAARQQAKSDRVELARRFKLNLDLGLTAHAREETRYFLEIAPDAGLALQRATVNWALQHEFEDAQLLIDAATVAGKPQAAGPVLAWIKQQRISVPLLRIPDQVRKAAE